MVDRRAKKKKEATATRNKVSRPACQHRPGPARQEVARELGAKLKAARQAHGFTEVGLSAEAGLARTVVGRIEKSERLTPTVWTLARLADAMGAELVIDFRF